MLRIISGRSPVSHLNNELMKFNIYINFLLYKYESIYTKNILLSHNCFI